MTETSWATKALRWVLVAPAALLAWIIPFAFLAIVGPLRAYPPTALDDLFAEGVAGFLFVVAGTHVAPSHRRPAALVLLVVLALISGFASVGLMVYEGALSLVGLLVSVVGAGIGYHVSTE